MATTLAKTGGEVIGGRTMRQSMMITREAERHPRFFDSKHRTIGVPVSDLEMQLEAKRLKDEQDAADQADYNKYMDQVLAMLKDADLVDAEKREKELRELAQHWRFQGDRTTRKEWALSDPDMLKKELPPCTETDARGCGPSSIQIFDGESGVSKEEVLARALKAQEENAKLIADRKAKLDAEREELRAHSLAQTAMLDDLDEHWKRVAAKKAMDTYNVMYENRRLARQKAVEARRKAELEKEEERAHFATMRDSAMLTEDRLAGYNAWDPRRKRRDHYRGMSAEEIAEIRRVQLAQIAEKEARLKAEKAGSSEYAVQARMLNEYSKEMIESDARDRADKERAHFLALKRQAREQRARKAKADAERLEPVDPDYWHDRFNRTTR